jgi:hypothetical protein
LGYFSASPGSEDHYGACAIFWMMRDFLDAVARQ